MISTLNSLSVESWILNEGGSYTNTDQISLINTQFSVIERYINRLGEETDAPIYKDKKRYIEICLMLLKRIKKQVVSSESLSTMNTLLRSIGSTRVATNWGVPIAQPLHLSWMHLPHMRSRWFKFFHQCDNGFVDTHLAGLKSNAPRLDQFAAKLHERLFQAEGDDQTMFALQDLFDRESLPENSRIMQIYRMAELRGILMRRRPGKRVRRPKNEKYGAFGGRESLRRSMLARINARHESKLDYLYRIDQIYARTSLMGMGRIRGLGVLDYGLLQILYFVLRIGEINCAHSVEWLELQKQSLVEERIGAQLAPLVIDFMLPRVQRVSPVLCGSLCSNPRGLFGRFCVHQKGPNGRCSKH